jgi:hypothetical protein|tara:strand:- start:56 stop:265 length:210 start_codon:yes stop_codon:yes gene_type:complete
MWVVVGSKTVFDDGVNMPRITRSGSFDIALILEHPASSDGKATACGKSPLEGYKQDILDTKSRMLLSFR